MLKRYDEWQSHQDFLEVAAGDWAWEGGQGPQNAGGMQVLQIAARQRPAAEGLGEGGEVGDAALLPRQAGEGRGFRLPLQYSMQAGSGSMQTQSGPAPAVASPQECRNWSGEQQSKQQS